MLDLPRSLPKRVALLLTSLLFVLVGLEHFRNPDFFVSIVPPWLPAPLTLVYVSGVFEILGGLGLLLPATRRWAGYGLVALLLAVFPANIHMAINADSFAQMAPKWGLYLRLPMQLAFIVWVLWASKPEGAAV